MMVRYEMRWLSSVLGVFLTCVAVSLGSAVWLVEWGMVEVGCFSMGLEMVVDSVSLVFMGVVLLITSCVLGFSKDYMVGEECLDRFVYLVMLFVASMGCLVFLPTLFGFMVGWDGLGVISFLLVIYYPSKSSLAAGMVTGVTNRVGDAFLVVAIILVGSWGSGWHGIEVVGIGGALVVVGSMTKSAQYPFSSWLLSAMAAPTPVSALVHSSTLVTAGVYLTIRLFPAIGSSELCLLEWSSALTVLLAGAAACLESDLKKVVALSTLSQVAIMMYCVSIGLPVLAYFHLLNHAVYKALLFICVGLVIGEYGQDIRRLGVSFAGDVGLKSYVVLCLLCLCGVPFFSGFYSKDLVLEGMMVSSLNVVSGVAFFSGVILSGCYSARLVYLCFFSGRRSGSLGVKGVFGLGVEGIHNYCFPLFLICLLFGGFGSWYFMGMSCVVLGGVHKVGILSCSVLGGLWFCGQMFVENSRGAGFYRLSGLKSMGSAKIFFSELGFLEGLTSQPLLWVSYQVSGGLYEWLDQGWLEFFGPSGIKAVLVRVSQGVGDYSKHPFNWFFLSYLAVLGWFGVSWGLFYL